MRFVFLSYVHTPSFNDPAAWINRLKGYTGILEVLSKKHTVISIEQISYSGNHTQNGVDYRFLNFGKNPSLLPVALHGFVKSLKPDIVIIHGLIFPLQVIQLRLLLGRKTRIIVQHHAEIPAIGLKKYFQKIAGNCIDACLFASRETGLDWVKKGNLAFPEKIFEVMEASSPFFMIDKAASRARLSLPDRKIYLWVGRLDQNKDPLTVVRAFLAFAKLCPASLLYMIFHISDLQQELEALIACEKTVILVGETAHADMQYWYNSADYIISGSHYEGSGVAVCEAMSCGCIPIVTDIPSFRKITDQGNCGFLYEAGNSQALLSVLLQTGNGNDDKKDLTLQQFSNHLSFEAIAGKIQEIASSL